MPPVGNDPLQIIFDLFTDLKNVEFHRVPKSIFGRIKEQSKSFEIIEDPANHDYVYNREKLVALPGGKLY